ncbi:GGDEF domain-containing protein [Aeromicrobium sp. CF3.5]|uniref:GGDEF domain-containing protein n=1 Tax=Aeromicrobium sp. CF3.5 TaxID=3373078 RepID=UPI003EE5392E
MAADLSKFGSDHFSESAQRVIEYLKTHTPLTDWSVSRVSGHEQVHVHVREEKVLEPGLLASHPDNFCMRMINGAAPVVVVDTLADPAYADVEHSETIRSCAGIRLTDDQGELFGALCGFGTDPLDSVDDVDADLLVLLGALLSTHLATARTADRNRHEVRIAAALAQTDALTGLTNRRGWNALTQDAQQRLDAYGDQVAVAVIDLDQVKPINDTLGHAAGDELIVRTAATLLACAGEGDQVARYGGDEFVILSNNVAADDLPRHFATFARALEKANISASCGFAASRPGAVSVADAFVEADRAMYAAKAQRHSLDL